MKADLPVIVSATISVTALMVLLALVWPQFFPFVPGITPEEITPQTVAATDMMQAQNDSLQTDRVTPPAGSGVNLSKQDSVVAHQPSKDRQSTRNAERDSIRVLLEALNQLRERYSKARSASRDSLSEWEIKTMAQIFEAMEAESAARILGNMDDRAVKQVLTTMKKRQSAKILATLSPQQAARILNARGEL